MVIIVISIIIIVISMIIIVIILTITISALVKTYIARAVLRRMSWSCTL